MSVSPVNYQPVQNTSFQGNGQIQPTQTKKPMSTGKKVAIGVGVVGAGAALICGLKTGKLQNIVKKIFKKADAKDAKTVVSEAGDVLQTRGADVAKATKKATEKATTEVVTDAVETAVENGGKNVKKVLSEAEIQAEVAKRAKADKLIDEAIEANNAKLTENFANISEEEVVAAFGKKGTEKGAATAATTTSTKLTPSQQKWADYNNAKQELVDIDDKIGRAQKYVEEKGLLKGTDEYNEVMANIESLTNRRNQISETRIKPFDDKKAARIAKKEAEAAAKAEQELIETHQSWFNKHAETGVTEAQRKTLQKEATEVFSAPMSEDAITSMKDALAREQKALAKDMAKYPNGTFDVRQQNITNLQNKIKTAEEHLTVDKATQKVEQAKARLDAVPTGKKHKKARNNAQRELNQAQSKLSGTLKKLGIQ